MKIGKIIVAFIFLLAATMHAQNSRWDYTAMTTTATYPAATFPALLSIPGASINFYTGCTQLPCSTYASVYTAITGTTACPVTSQVVPAQTGVCTSTTDNQGNFGGWFLPGQYEWVITLPSNGQQLGPFPFTIGNPQAVPGFPLSIANGGTGQTSGLAALNALGNSGSGTISFNNAFTSISINGVPDPLFDAGSDIGAQLNAVFTAMGNNCGTVAIPPGTYSYSTQIDKPRCVHLEGNNANLIWTGTNVNNPAIVTGSLNGGPNYTTGGISNLYLFGNGSATGIYMGGPTGSYTVPGGGSVLDFLETFENVTVFGFYDNWVKGVGPSQNNWISGGSISSSHSNFLDTGSYGSENMNFFGWQNLNSGGWGLYGPNLTGSVYNFTNCSFDYNTLGNWYVGNGYIHTHGLYMESTWGVPFINGPADSSAGYSTVITMDGGTNFSYLSSTSITAPIVIQGFSSYLTIGDGLTVYSPNASLTELVDWLAVSGANTLIVKPFFAPTGTIPAVQSGANVQWLNVPLTAGGYTPVSEYFPSITISSSTAGDISGGGLVGSTLNFNGTVPATSRFPFYEGSYLGWNALDLGEGDYFNAFSASTGSNPAFSWFANNSGTLDQVANIWRNGTINSGSGGFAINGTVGFSGTKSGAACVFTISGGIITNVTGC